MAIKIIPVIIIVVSTFFYLFLFDACKKKETLLNSPKLVRKILEDPIKSKTVVSSLLNMSRQIVLRRRAWGGFDF